MLSPNQLARLIVRSYEQNLIISELADATFEVVYVCSKYMYSTRTVHVSWLPSALTGQPATPKVPTAKSSQRKQLARAAVQPHPPCRL